MSTPLFAVQQFQPQLVSQQAGGACRQRFTINTFDLAGSVVDVSAYTDLYCTTTSTQANQGAGPFDRDISGSLLNIQWSNTGVSFELDSQTLNSTIQALFGNIIVSVSNDSGTTKSTIARGTYNVQVFG